MGQKAIQVEDFRSSQDGAAARGISTPAQQARQSKGYGPVAELSEPDVVLSGANLNAFIHSHRKNDLARDQDAFSIKRAMADFG